MASFDQAKFDLEINATIDEAMRKKIIALNEENDRLRAELAEARKDTARLDWFFAWAKRLDTMGWTGFCFRPPFTFNDPCTDNYRDAIDAAMTAMGEKP